MCSLKSEPTKLTEANLDQTRWRVHFSYIYDHLIAEIPTVHFSHVN